MFGKRWQRRIGEHRGQLQSVKLRLLYDMAACEVPQEEDGTVKSNSVTVLVENEKPIDSEDVVEGKPRSSSIAWSTRSSTANQLQRTREKFRSLKRRSSVENFGQFGFLVPALALFPQADGVSTI